MDDKDEVDSDNGSFELINSYDYLSDPENLNIEADASGNLDQSDDGSYVFIRSREGNNSTTDSDDETTEPSQSEEEEEGDDDDDDDDDDGPLYMEFNGNREVRKNRNFTYFDHIPANMKLKEDMEIKDVVKDHVLCYLPAKALARSRLVSKEWNKWISGPFLAHLQSQYFNKTSGFFQDDNNGFITFISLDKSAYGVPNPSLSFLPVRISIRSSCNGLILCEARDEENEYYVCNPVNKEWVKLPFSSYYHGHEPKIVIAFEPSSLDFEPCYKVICAFSIPGIGPEPIFFDIYDSETKSWRISDVICADLDKCSLKNDGVFVDGVVYWETIGGEMLAFDLANEIYGIQTLPLEKSEFGALSKVHGELSYVEARYDWLSKKCGVDFYGGTLMTSKKSISFDVSFDVLEDGEPVECAVLGSCCGNVSAVVMKKIDGPTFLYVYNVKDQKVETVKRLWFSDTSRLFPYINSLGSVVTK